MATRPPHGMDIESFRQAGYRMVDRIADYFSTLEQRPVWSQASPGYLSELVGPTAPEEGESWNTIDKDIDRVIMPGIAHWQSPTFFAWFPANATPEGVLGDMLAATVGNPGFNWTCSPALTELELRVVDWLARMFGLSPAFLTSPEPSEMVPGHQGGGIILGSASEVALTMAVAARERAIRRLSEQIPMPQEEGAPLAAWRGAQTAKLVMYVTTQTHSIGTKAALILGLDVRKLPVTKADNFGLRGDVVRAAIEEDEAQGRVPFMLIGTVGSTNTCAIDRLDEVAQVIKGHPMWLHIDSAFAGVSLTCPELRPQAHLDAINQRADSFSTNMHKWGLTQFDCSPVFVRRKADLTSALTVTPHYLRTQVADAGEVTDMRNMQLALGRRFRSCKLYFILRSFGVEGLRQHIRSKYVLPLDFTLMSALHPSDSSQHRDGHLLLQFGSK